MSNSQSILQNTEVGSIPSHWDVVPFREVCTESAFGPRFSGNLYSPDGNVATLRTTDVDDWGRISYSTMPLAKLDTEKFEKHFLKPGDLVITRSGTCGRTAIFEGFHVPVVPGAFSIRFRLSSQVDNRFFRYYFNSNIGRQRVIALTTGTVQPNLTSTALLSLKVPLPPLDEQKAIAHILGTLDDKIELNQQMNGTLEVIARAIFKSWFVDFDPVRAKMDGRQPAGMDAATADLFPDSFEDSPLGKIPKGWRTVQIEDIASRVAMGPFGSRITTDNFVDTGVPVIRGNNLVDGFNEDNFVYLTDEKADELRSSNAFPEDIVFTHRGTLGQVGFIPKSAAYPRYVVSQSQMFLSVNKSQVSPKLIYRFFRSPSGQQALLANTNTTGVPAIARPSTSLKAIQLVIPLQSISDRFEQLTNSLDSRQESNTKESNTLTAIRDALLPKLLSGEIRIKEAEKLVGDSL